MTIIRVGVDTSKHLFQVHGVDEAEQPVLRRQVRRGAFVKVMSASWRRRGSAWRRAAPRITGRECCGGLGHEVVLLPPQYVKPYVKRGKHDAADAWAFSPRA